MNALPYNSIHPLVERKTYLYNEILSTNMLCNVGLFTPYIGNTYLSGV